MSKCDVENCNKEVDAVIMLGKKTISVCSPEHLTLILNKERGEK
jgi:hypothetical protein